MKSNYQMLREFKDFKPQLYGILSKAEMNIIREHFEIGKRSEIDLCNLRDFVVLYYENLGHDELVNNRYKEFRKLQDVMSGIVGVIDNEKVRRGMVV